MQPNSLEQAERLTLGVLLCGVMALAFSDFVSPVYWSLVMLASGLRLWRGPKLSMTEMQASLFGWAGLFWVGLELLMGRALVVAFTDFLLILALAVVAEEATPRNHLHRLIVGLFLILAAAVLTDSVLYSLPLAAFIILLWRASRRLYGMQLPGGDLELGSWHADMRAFAFVLTASILLFVIVPRVGLGKVLRNVQPQLVTSGFSDRVQLGDFARRLDPTVIMRVENLGEDKSAFRQAIAGRYWRGVALSRYDGSSWSKERERRLRHWRTHGQVRLSDSKPDIAIAIYREAVNHVYVFLTGNMVTMENVPQAVFFTDIGSLKFSKRPTRRLRLHTLISRKSHEPDLRSPNAWESVRPESNVINSWARKVTARAGSDRERLSLLVAELRSWEYDLNAPIDNRRPIEYFIERTRSGHCEMFASALALASRSLGIPARVVNGYYGGDWNAVGGFFIIRQQHAHAWVEAWVGGRWQRFDGTPASRWALSGVRFPAWDNVWESVKLAWYRYVLEFQDQDRTALWALIKHLAKSYVFELLALLLLAGLLALLHVKTGHIRLHREKSAWPVLDRWLIRRGFHRKYGLPLRRLPLPNAIEAGQWQRFVDAWERQAYGVAAPWNKRMLKRHLRALSAARW